MKSKFLGNFRLSSEVLEECSETFGAQALLDLILISTNIFAVQYYGKEPSYGILSYFGHVQNYIYKRRNLKMIAY